MAGQTKLSAEAVDRPINYPDEAGNLHDFYERRAEIESVLNDTLRKIAERLLALVPDELEIWKESRFPDVDTIVRWLNDHKKFMDTKEGFVIEPSTDEEIDDEDEKTGLKDRADAIVKYKLLKKAWEGIIDVQIVEEEDPDDTSLYIHYSFLGATKSIFDEEK